ncbi:unnamed protein product [Tilletia controversa]|uniref:Uncharacterized protein n=3 Tax=Tilletia TaxID=13289 RepID=A0A8X7T023_9BASI|nr:hypothetical protein CF328_g6272 [Tilletia controversa]KAE8196625.1 hypothetical protein CF336_g2534 [Tilletia laevis]KAE8252912.1 hypothetical protein A4X03_0g6039 [Tilletia caries]KAE8207238.1 hypothetical protein CF335_g1287 [Tilletia laevis]KAE8254050.1 hypothetical protein A4X06_0g1092 [Tilletia controversa]
MKISIILAATAIMATTAACAVVPPQITAAPAVKRIYRPRPAKAVLNVAAANKRGDDDDDDDNNDDDDNDRNDDDGSYDSGSDGYDGQSSYTYRSNGRVYTVTMNDGSWSGNRNHLTDDLLDMLPEATDSDTLASLSRVYASITADPTLSQWINVPSVSRAIVSASRAANTNGKIRHSDGNPFDERSGAMSRASPMAGLAVVVAAAAGAVFALV